MIKEYLYLSDEELLVIDEKGHATKRNIESTNMHDVLLLENDLEKIDGTIDMLEKLLQQKEKNMVTKKEKTFLSVLPFITGMAVFGLVCLLDSSFYTNIIPATIALSLGTVVIDSGFAIEARRHKKYINGMKNELLTAYQLREGLNKQISEIKIKSKASTKLNVIESFDNNRKINNVILLEDSTPFYEDATKQLEESYSKGFEQKAKKLVLKKQM